MLILKLFLVVALGLTVFFVTVLAFALTLAASQRPEWSRCRGCGLWMEDVRGLDDFCPLCRRSYAKFLEIGRKSGLVEK